MLLHVGPYAKCWGESGVQTSVLPVPQSKRSHLKRPCLSPLPCPRKKLAMFLPERKLAMLVEHLKENKKKERKKKKQPYQIYKSGSSNKIFAFPFFKSKLYILRIQKKNQTKIWGKFVQRPLIRIIVGLTFCFSLSGPTPVISFHGIVLIEGGHVWEQECFLTHAHLQMFLSSESVGLCPWQAWGIREWFSLLETLPLPENLLS